MCLPQQAGSELEMHLAGDGSYPALVCAMGWGLLQPVEAGRPLPACMHNIYMHTHIQNTPTLTHVRAQGQLRAQINEYNICVGTHRLTTLLHGAVLDTYGRAQTCTQTHTPPLHLHPGHLRTHTRVRAPTNTSLMAP